jgi:hypothetical protein
LGRNFLSYANGALPQNPGLRRFWARMIAKLGADGLPQVIPALGADLTLRPRRVLSSARANSDYRVFLQRKASKFKKFPRPIVLSPMYPVCSVTPQSARSRQTR